MAVVEADIAADLLAVYSAAAGSPTSESDFADAMATVIKDAILSAQADPDTGVIS